MRNLGLAKYRLCAGIALYTLSFVVLLNANAATLNYISSDSLMSVRSENRDDFGVRDIEYFLTSGPAAGELTDFSDTLVGNGAGNSGNTVSGSFSGLGDTTGFSVSGTLTNVEGYGGAGNFFCDLEECVHYSLLERSVRFSLSEETTLYLTADWADLTGVTSSQSVLRGTGDFYLRPVGGSDIYLLNLDDRFFPESGVEQFSAQVGPGTYDVFMRFYAVTNSVALDGDSSSVTGTFTVSTVPVPAAVWLFGSALAGLGWMRRKQTA